VPQKEMELSLVFPGAEERRVVAVNVGVMSYNDERAALLRRRYREAEIVVFNVMSSPGAGKTELLARTLDAVGAPSAVIVGDLATDNDARRLRGVQGNRPVAQIMTGGVCHLEAAMIERALAALPLEGVRLLAIENVGNLVCPAGFDLGEDFRVVLFSVTEGEDKPLKYPKMFKHADAVVVNKMDLAAAAGFDRSAAGENLRLVAPGVPVFWLSARSGAGMASWLEFLRRRIHA